MNKKSLVLKMVGFLFLFVPFFINTYNFLRFVSLLLGIIFLCFGFFLLKKINIIKIVLYPLLLFILLYGIDYSCVFFLERFPIFAYENIADVSFSTYDSLFYRIYNCKEKRTLDLFYQSNYLCEHTLEEKEINAFLANGANNYQKYHGKFVTIKGKVSEVFGNEYLTLQTYEQKENSLVGQLTFNKDITLKVINNHGNLKLYNNYEIYDNVLVTGRIVKREKNTIIMYDANIRNRNNFDDFEVNIIENKTCKNKLKKLTTVGDYHYFSNCLDEVFVKYDEETIYDIILALETKKLTFDKWVEESDKEEDEAKELYKFDDYHLLKCKESNTIVIGNKNLKLKSKVCETIME